MCIHKFKDNNKNWIKRFVHFWCNEQNKLTHTKANNRKKLKKMPALFFANSWVF